MNNNFWDNIQTTVNDCGYQFTKEQILKRDRRIYKSNEYYESKTNYEETKEYSMKDILHSRELIENEMKDSTLFFIIKKKIKELYNDDEIINNLSTKNKNTFFNEIVLSSFDKLIDNIYKGRRYKLKNIQHILPYFAFKEAVREREELYEDITSLKLPVTDLHDAPRRGADINLHRYKCEIKENSKIYHDCNEFKDDYYDDDVLDDNIYSHK
jgi:hypothetical protein